MCGPATWQVATPPRFNMMEAEQYFSAESFTARATFFSVRFLPETTKCIAMRV